MSGLYIAIMLLQVVVAALTIANLILVRRHWRAHRAQQLLARRLAQLVGLAPPTLYDGAVPKGQEVRDDPPQDFM